MIINRHNYEEMFLLYVDNELTPAERAAVENFVAACPDLAPELETLQQVVLHPLDKANFEFKNSLLKAGDDINSTNYQLYCLRYVDDDLTAAEKEQVELFVLQHPALQNEFVSLQQTRLMPEEIVFTNKSVLYRSSRRTIPLYMRRLAIAAVFMGLMFSLFTLSNQNETTLVPAQTVATKSKQNNNNLAPIMAPTVDSSSSVAREQATNAVKSIPIETKNAQPASKQKMVMIARQKVQPDRIRNNAQMVNPKPVVIPQNKVDNQQDLAVIATKRLSRENFVDTEAAPEKVEAAPQVYQAAYKELDTRSEDEDNTILFGSTQINKKKLRGLLKKATRLFDKGEENDTGDKPIKIASFEIKGK